ncbi:insulinase family protein [Acidiferrimicrobium sp. IK]|uniref:M16 family metallopeptidase n=1 Tax=Acidiferrimicrobium sp. IK TaxID=2871700 RepID=UPI0021CB8760|nr:pitrilysin family protein [Acidiferrimicrobium sp. IK]MCU4183736.1 insulinase family protein [Acidiferrimicrobium sp. IK]
MTQEALATTTLDNGLTVVTERMTEVRSVAMGFWVGTGSVDEEPADSGASHFLEHLLFKGTPTRSARQIAETVDAVGGDINAFTAKEYTAFYVRALAADAELGLEILSDIIWSPSFRPEEVEAERQVILEEILMHGDEPGDLVHDVFAEALFPDHPLGREVLGDESTIRAMPPERIAAFHAHHYRPANLVFAAAGNIDHAQIVAGLQAGLDRADGGRPGGARPRRDPPGAATKGEAMVVRPTEQAHLIVGVRGPRRDDPERHALTVLDHVVGGGMSSRLFQSIREERGLAYSVYSYRLAFEHSGGFAVYAGTSPGQVEEVLELIHAELDRVASEGITAGELTAARSHLRGSLALGLEDSGARMSRIAHSQLVHGEVPTVEELDARLDAVTVESVGDLARSLLSEARTTVVVGPSD